MATTEEISAMMEQLKGGTAPPAVTNPAPDDTFVGKIKESFARGKEDVLADIAVYEGLNSDEQDDLIGALMAREKSRLKQVQSPIDDSFMENLVYKAASTAGQIVESAKRLGTGAAIGAVGGGVVGLGVGALIPTVGEESLTTAAGAKVGMKLGAKFGGAVNAALFSYKQGAGGMYADMRSQGIDHEVSKQVAQVAAIPYSLVEVMQLKALGKPVARAVGGAAQAAALKGAKAIALKAAVTYGKTLGEETGEELLQEVIQMSAENVAKFYQDEGILIDASTLAGKSKLAWEAAKAAASNIDPERLKDVAGESLQAFALLPIPGAALETGVAAASAQIDSEWEGINDRVQNETSVQAKDMHNPSAQLFVALRSSIEKTLGERVAAEGMEPARKLQKEQEKIRKEERKARLGRRAGTLREENTANNWTAAIKSDLKGETYTELGLEPLKTYLPNETYQLLKEQIRTRKDVLKTFEAFKLDEGLDALFNEGKPIIPSVIEFAEKLWGAGVANQLKHLSEIAKDEKIRLTDYLAIPKVTAASGDLSRTLRQNIMAMGQPKEWFKAFATDMKLLLKDDATARLLEKDALTDEEVEKFIAYGGRWNNWGPGSSYQTGTERFPSRIGRVIPGVARSERAYALGGNLLRANLWKKVYSQWKSLGRSEKDFKDLANVINLITGEGNGRLLGRHAEFLNAVFFAPRLTEARFLSVADLFNPNISKHARKYLAVQQAKFIGINVGVLALMAQMPGVKVDRDPRSTDFGKFVIGKTHYDFWGGYLPMARILIRLATGERLTQGGKVVDAEVGDTITRFLQAKLGPVPAAVLDILKGETFFGKDIKADEDGLAYEMYSRFVPFFLQDMADAIDAEGMGKGAAIGGLAFLGAGTQTYSMTKGAESAQLKERLALEYLQTPWDELGQIGQDFLRARHPEIEMLDRQAKWERQNQSFMAQIEKSTKASKEKVYKAMPRDVQQELDENQIILSGVGRRIGTNWYLSDERHKEYEDGVVNAYRKVMPKLVRSKVWDRIPPVARAELIKRVADEIKKGVRDKIVGEAKLSDIKKIMYR